jgi:hypothetical protein
MKSNFSVLSPIIEGRNDVTAGCEGKVKKDIRSAFELIVEGNLSNIENWLSDVAADNQAKALEFVFRISEFIVPKMRSVAYNTGPVEPEKNYVLMAAIRRINETYKGYWIKRSKLCHPFWFKFFLP